MKEPALLIKHLRLLADGYNPEDMYDLSIEDGIISEITLSSEGKLENSKAVKVINDVGLKIYASIGWFDLRSSFGEPGEEYKESLESGCKAAAAGGFTELLLTPNTQPVIDTKAGIQSIRNYLAESPVKLHVAAAVSVGAQGEQLTELIDLSYAGALAYTDGHHPVSDPSLILKILQYLQGFDGLFINQPTEPRLVNGGQMHEGIVSTTLGMKGIPALSECMALKRDLDLLRYAGGKLHVSGVSSAQGVRLIKEAKAEGLAVTAEVYVSNLVFIDENLESFDTNYKHEPPLRSQADRTALLKGIQDGTIDAIATDHRPQDTECKRVEFDLASPGAIGLQTAISLLLRAGLSLPLLVEKLALAPRQILGLPMPEIKVGAKANINLIAPEYHWQYDKTTNKSLSANSPVWNSPLVGKSVGVIAHNKQYFDDELVG